MWNHIIKINYTIMLHKWLLATNTSCKLLGFISYQESRTEIHAPLGCSRYIALTVPHELWLYYVSIIWSSWHHTSSSTSIICGPSHYFIIHFITSSILFITQLYNYIAENTLFKYQIITVYNWVYASFFQDQPKIGTASRIIDSENWLIA